MYSHQKTSFVGRIFTGKTASHSQQKLHKTAAGKHEKTKIHANWGARRNRRYHPEPKSNLAQAQANSVHVECTLEHQIFFTQSEKNIFFPMWCRLRERFLQLILPHVGIWYMITNLAVYKIYSLATRKCFLLWNINLSLSSDRWVYKITNSLQAAYKRPRIPTWRFFPFGTPTELLRWQYPKIYRHEGFVLIPTHKKLAKTCQIPEWRRLRGPSHTCGVNKRLTPLGPTREIVVEGGLIFYTNS